MNKYWNLEPEEFELVEQIWDAQGIIFIDENGDLQTTVADNYKHVKSVWFDTLDDFAKEVRAAQVLKVLIKNENKKY